MKIYIQTNSKQYLASKVSAYSFFRFGHQPILMNLEEIGILKNTIGKKYLRNGRCTKYKNDLQSFTLLRFYAPELNNYEDKILVIDPDIFALKDPKELINELSPEYDLCCTFANNLARSEIMLIDAKKVKWNFQNLIYKLFNFQLDYTELMSLRFDDQIRIKRIENRYNEHDKILDETILLHTTNRITQPWKEGLNIDFEYYNNEKFFFLKNILKKAFGLNYNQNYFQKEYIKHPDDKVILTIKNLFNEAKDNKYINKEEIDWAIKNGFISSKIFS
jgi:hypothetical protein